MGVAARFVVGVALMAPPSVDDAKQAEAALAVAMELHDEGRLEEASAKLADAYALYPDRDYLYTRGVIERTLGRCEVAVPLFEAFIAAHPSLADIEAAQAQIGQCQPEEPEPAPAPGPVAPPEPVLLPVTTAPALPPAPTNPPARVDRGDRHWSRDAAGGALLGAGLGVAVAGVALLGVAARRAQAADTAATAGDYRTLQSGARALSISGLAVLGVGAVAVIGGVVRYALVARDRPSRQRDTVALD